MKIVITGMRLTNFKKVRSAFYEFSDNVTSIFGANGAGKTTIKDAFLWCLFGKDSTNRKDFEIKTLDENNQPFHNLDHEVELILQVNGEEVNIKRSLREKWVKRRGDVTPEFKGHETTFFWDDVPCQLKEFEAKVDALINEDLFKLVTSPAYFNALDWKVRRSTLLAIAGEITNDNVIAAMQANGQHVHELLIKALAQKKTPEQFKLEIAAKKKTIKDELVLIPSRIDEANRTIGEAVDYYTLEKAKARTEADLQQVEDELLDITRQVQQQQNAKAAKIKEQGALKQNLLTREFELKQTMLNQQQERVNQIDSLQRTINGNERSLNELKAECQRYATKIAGIESRQTQLRAQWQTVNAETLQFDANQFCCPTCKRELEGVDMEAKKEEFTKNFNADKANRLATIQKDGADAGKELETAKADLYNCESNIKALEVTITNDRQALESLRTANEQKISNEAKELQSLVETDKDAIALRTQIETMQADIDADITPISNADQLQRKQTLRQEIDSYTRELAGKVQRDNTLARINELKDQEHTMSQDLADLEGIEFSIEQFTKEKMDELDRRINGRFQIVKFKLFDTQINGGVVECCETLINGVPYSDANTASRINAGIDIVNTLCDHYGVRAPMFLDNRESVSDIIDTDSQVINLIVSPADTKLRVVKEEMAEAV